METSLSSQAARDSASAVIRTCLGVKPPERLSVVAEPDGERVAREIWAFARGEGLRPALLVAGGWGAEDPEPPAAVTALLGVSDAVVCVSRRPFVHSRARREACARGARIAVLPDPSWEVFEGAAMRADYLLVSELARRVASLLTGAQRATLCTRGFNLHLSLAGREGHADTGLIDEPGRAGILPAGEAFIAPLEGTAEGELVLDGSILGRMLDGPLLLKFNAGRLMDAEGDAAGELMDLVRRTPGGALLAELGVGCNPCATLRGRPPEDEKVLGSVHVALGGNWPFGGLASADLHLDAVVRSPDLYLDGAAVISGGRLAPDLFPERET